MTEPEKLDLVIAARNGLCGVCQWSELVRSSKGSLFVLCKNPALPKYQGQPVLRCAYFEPRKASET